MREILFRGKRKDNGEWIEGDLLHDRFIFSNEKICRIYNEESKLTHRQDLVIPETVGQYTGLPDKNGKKIFEGDIVEFYFFDKEHKNTKTMQVEWRDSGFCMRELFRNYRLADDFSIIDEKIFTYRNEIRNGVYRTNNVYFIEVIGNIHDNPELLKGE